MTARDVWRWTDERGVQRLVGTDELRSALAGSVLPASTLVWRDGMKEWAPASTVPELASAAFAAEVPAAAKREVVRDEDSFDARSTLKESARRATLIGLTAHGSDHAAAGKAASAAGGDGASPAHALVVPSPGAASPGAGVTQIPPFGGPVVEPIAPAAPRVPSVGRARPPVVENGARPTRKITTTEIDSLWAPTEDDETIPRRALPSELAAAAAATAEATAAQRDARLRSKGEIDPKRGPSGAGPRPPLPDRGARKPAPPPRPGAEAKPSSEGAARLAQLAQPEATDKREPVPGKGLTPRAPPAAPVRPLPKPPLKTLSGAGAPSVARPPSPPTRPVTLGNGPLGVPVKPVVAPITTPVRVRPPSPGGSSEPITGESQTMPASSLHAVTLLGVAAPAILEAEAAAAAPRKEVTSTLVSPGAVPPEELVTPEPPEPVAPPPAALPLVAPEPEALLVTIPMDALVEVAEPVLASPSPSPQLPPQQPVRDETTEQLPDLVGEGAPVMELEAGPRPEPIGPLPPPRPPLPSRAPGRPRQASDASEPAHPPHPAAHAHVEEAPAYTPAPPAGTPTPPMVRAAPSSAAPVALPTRSPLVSDGGELEIAGLRGRGSRSRAPVPVPVPLSSLFGAGGVLIGMVIAAFFVGRASAVPVPRLTARPALGALPALARAAVPPPPKPCWMAKQPAMWAPRVSRSIPFDAVATTAGKLAVGYARDAKVAVGVEVDLATGEVQPRFEDKADEEIERVVPTPAAEFAVARAGGPGALRSPIEVPVASGAPFAVGLDGASWALAAPPTGPASPLWPLSGDDKVAAASVHPAGDKGYALTFRQGSGAILGGWIGADRKASGALVTVAGSGGSVGKPTAAWNGRELAVIFADRPDKGGHYEIRIGHAAAGTVPATTSVLPLPRGGPGGDAFAPDIAGLPDGRWLLMWTEGAAGSRAVRAQTLASDFTPLGDPIALSPPAGNYGQGVIGVAGGHAATVFLSKGASSFELWGAVLQCQ